MISLFTLALVLHVLVAVLGLGSILSIAVIAVMGRRGRRDPIDVLPWLRPLLRLSTVSLVAMLGTGVILDLAAKGGFHEFWWFRASALLLVAAGALNGRARRIVQLGFAQKAESGVALQRVERLAYAMCGFVAGITILMEVQPF